MLPFKRGGLIFLLPLILFLLLSSCENLTNEILPTPNTNVYVIKKGKHTSGTFFQTTKSSYKKYEVIFDSTAIYQTKLSQNQGDINKLVGFSDCGSQHHVNSARFGWRWYNNKLEIHGYTYANKVQNSKYIGNIVLNKPSIIELKLEDDKYIFVLDGKKISLPRACTGNYKHYMLYPYFGGDEVAPHEIRIKIREL